MNKTQYIQPYLRTNALLNNYNNTKESSINEIIDDAFNASSKNFIIIIGNIIADILNKYNIEKSVVIIHYIIQKINMPVKVEEKYIILDIIRRLTLRSDDISNNLINEIRLKYDSEDDIKQYLNNSKSNNSNSTKSNKTINKNDCFKAKENNTYTIKIIGFFKNKYGEVVLSLDAQNQFSMPHYESFLEYYERITTNCNITLDMTKIKNNIVFSNNSYYALNGQNGYSLFNDSKLKEAWTPPN